MSQRPVQYFSDEQLRAARRMTPTQICRFLDDFRQLTAQSPGPVPRTSISLRVQRPLLRAFRLKAEREGVRYQTQIQRLMRAWLDEG